MNPQNPQQPMPTPAPMSPMPVEHKKVGPIIAILIIVLILVIGALYLLASKVNQQQIPAPTDNAAVNSAASATPMEVQPVTSKADDMSSLQADLDASTQGLDAQNF